MNLRRTLPVALAAIALATSAAALLSPAAANPTTTDTSYQDGSGGNSSTENGTSSSDYNDTDGNQTRDGSQDNETRDGSQEQRDGNDTSGSSHQGPGDDRDDADRPPERTGPEERDVRVELDDDRARFRSEARDGDRRSELRMELRGDDSTLDLEFENRTEEGRVDLDLELRLPLLVEFDDADGDGAYDPDEAAVQTVDLRDRNPNLTVEETPVGPEVTSTYDLPGNGTFAVDVLLPSSRATVAGQPIRPEEAKIDFRIDGFPYQANGTRLALTVEVDAGYEARGPAADATGVTLPGDGAAGHFRWQPNASVDGVRHPVASTVSALQGQAEPGETQGEYVIRLAYARGETVVHDPTFGVESIQEAAEAVQETLGHLPTYVIAAGATAVLAGGLAYARTRTGPR